REGQRDRVHADAEECRLAEREDPGVAPQEVHGDRGDREEEGLREDLLRVFAQDQRAREKSHAQREDRGDDAADAPIAGRAGRSPAVEYAVRRHGRNRPAGAGPASAPRVVTIGKLRNVGSSRFVGGEYNMLTRPDSEPPATTTLRS